MALSGSTYTNFTNNGAFRLVTDWSATQNVAGNYSDVTAQVFIQSLQSWAAVSDGTTSLTSITINGDRKEFQAYSTCAAWEKKLLGSHTVRVPHNSDGSKQIAIYSSHNFDISWNGAWVGTVYCETWPWLDTIVRASAVWTSNTSGVAVNQRDYGETIRLNITKSDPTFLHTVSRNLHDSYQILMDKGSASYVDFVIPLSMMDEIPSVTSMWGKFSVDTWTAGGAYVGGTEIWWETFVPSTVKPTIGSLTVTESVSALLTLMGAGNYVQGASIPSVTMNSVTQAYSSPIVLYEFLFEGKYYNQTTVTSLLDKPTSYGAAQTITCAVKDARGRWSASVQTTIKVIAYTPPTITAFTAARQTPTTTVNAYRKGTISPLNNGTANKNTTSIKVEYRLSGTTGAYTLGNTTSSTTNFDASVAIGTAFSIASAYEVKLTVTDSVSPAVTSTIAVGAVVKPFSIGPTGIGAGKIWTQGALDVLGDSYLTGNVTVTGTGGNVYHTGKKPTPAEIGASATSHTHTLASLGAEASSVYGSNANGEYIKFANGVVMAWKTITINDSTGITTGKSYDWNAGTPPIAMSDYLLQATVNFYDWAGGYGNFRAIVGNATGSAGNIYIYSGSSGATTMNIRIMYMGRV